MRTCGGGREGGRTRHLVPCLHGEQSFAFFLSLVISSHLGIFPWRA